mmetsp:Transcript_35043/g.60330  ORF Transcript_35043/g.60330 Transcript_35043/m.60330 type:complete len:224 (-) Transcript_35043:192-863(-)
MCATRSLVGGSKQLVALKNALVSMYRSNPRLANAFTGCATFFMGDVLAQKIELKKTKREDGYDLVRAAQVGLLGIVMNGFFIHHWYHGLDKVVGSSMTSKVVVGMKVAADQLIYAPFSIASFFYFTSFRKTGDITEANKEFMPKMESLFVQTFAADCALWPLANFVNFRFVTLTYRPTFTAVVQLMWQTYMSATSSNSHVEVREREMCPEAGTALVLCKNTIK